ncbi:asparagine synthase (glutamine-hydrolysing) [Paenibacillus castaneae]|uniref:asparagine synthase-related protein n=1 Tax=Paenibacillus castaneae TaxID=474957 RepID=UPI000C9B631A|nr:asparagine synthase-related protein [Paenibacillus castaneae]NIK76080.1 asparagine synthase (glutamine-hydrolysing) [Paenibacillus castaneae]
MSAIAGVYHMNTDNQTREQGNSMMEALSHYPCDTSQSWQKDNVFLGCHNQWITPESIGERNPYYDSDRRLVIIADAIIDNRKELFQLLDVRNDFRDQMTDAQLILLSYSKWGVESPKYLIGDFVFIIWDEREQRVFAARDFSGSRTLYYHWNGERLAMCTTMKALFNLPNVEKQLNEQWLAQFLAISTVVDAVDITQNVFKDIWQLPPSHCITIEDGRLKVMRYFTLSVGKKIHFKSDEQYVEAFQAVFQEAVDARLRTHRQVGSQLSGGLDSGAVVGFAAKTLRPLDKQIHTFSYTPSNEFIDYTPRHMIANETPYINSTVQYVGGINPNYLDFADRNSYSEIDPCLDALEMPYKYFSNSFWIRGIFEKAAEQDVGVLLTGARGNLTISWGEALTNYVLLFKKLKWIRLQNELKAYSKNMRTGRARLLSLMSKEAIPMLDRSTEVQDPFKPIINKEFARKTKVFDQLREHGMDESGWFTETNIFNLRKQHFEDPFTWISTNTAMSKFSLPTAVWSRDPTNDIRVIRFCLSVPEDQYVYNGYNRALIRRATVGMLPDEVRLNQHIRGVQGADWIHRMQPDWHSFIMEAEEMSRDSAILEFIDGSMIKSALSRFKNNVKPELAWEAELQELMWSLIVYRFIKRNF